MTRDPERDGHSSAEAPSGEAIDTLRRLLASSTNREEERRILALLASAQGSDLDRILAALDMRVLLGSIDDRLIGPDHRTELLQMLTVDRLGDLSSATRAAIAAALQYGPTSLAEERAIRNILLGTHGRDLTDLKSAIDSGGHYRDMHQMLFHDIDNDALRDEILEHFMREAPAARISEVKVLSDVDDTFYANWKDKRFPSKTIYPGVLQFYAELDRGPGDEPGRAGDLTFVTARPGDRLGLVENATHRALEERGVPARTILAGGFTRLIGNRAIAAKKLENFEEYRRVYPEYGFVFVGDSGQGDVLFGQRMIELGPKEVKGIFIHDVVSTPEAAREEYRQRGIYFFDTYVGAALEAHRLGLLQRTGMARVAAAAIAGLGSILFASEARREARAGELARDIERVNAELRLEERVSIP